MVEVGTAVYRIEAETSGLKAGIAEAKRAVESLEDPVRQVNRAFQGQSTISQQAMFNLVRGQRAAAEATTATTRAMFDQTRTLSQLGGLMSGSPLGALSSVFGSTQVAMAGMVPVLAGVAAGFVAVRTASAFLGWMEEHSASTAVAMGELGAASDSLQDRIAGDLAPAVDHVVEGLTGLVIGAENAWEALTRLARVWTITIDVIIPGDQDGTIATALLSGARNAFAATPLGLVFTGLDEAAGDVEESVEGMSIGMGDFAENLRMSRAQADKLRQILAATAEQIHRGARDRGQNPLVSVTPPAVVPGRLGVLADYAGLAAQVKAMMLEALYPAATADTTYSALLTRTEDTIKQLIAHKHTRGLTPEEEGTLFAQGQLYAELIGEGAASANMTTWLDDLTLTSGKATDAAFTYGRQLADQVMAGFQQGIAAKAILEDPTEEWKTGLEQNVSGEPIMQPLIDDLITANTQSDTLGTNLGVIATTPITPYVSTAWIDYAIQRALLLQRILFGLGDGGGGGGGSNPNTPTEDRAAGASFPNVPPRKKRTVGQTVADVGDRYNGRRRVPGFL